MNVSAGTLQGRLRYAVVALIALSACGEPSSSEHSPRRTRTSRSQQAHQKARASDAPPPAPAEHADAPLLVTNAGVLMELEQRGFGLADVLSATGASNAALVASSTLFRELVRFVRFDDSVVKGRDPNARVGLRGTHRLFDPAWLWSENSRFELVAVVNRMDRMHTTPNACGDTRLIYRLAYTSAGVESRLPMTLNVVFTQAGECKVLAQQWLALRRASNLGDALVAGALHDISRPVRLETNFQSGRWPAGVRPTLGGHAEYVLRVFRIEGDQLVQGTLENTPTQRLTGTQRTDLRAWLTEHVAEIDRGTALLPDSFLALRSISVTPRSLARLANRPFVQFYPRASSSFANDLFAQADLVHSADGFIRRLDEMTCKGCHASRSLAGFHVLGEDRAGSPALNSIAVGMSPHLLRELPWRRAFLEAVARGEVYPVPRPFAERGISDGDFGDACGISDPTFAPWSCAEGLSCRNDVGDDVGVCVDATGNHLGAGVERGTMQHERTGMRDRIDDRVVEGCSPDAPNMDVAHSSDGFPAGMCHAPCERFGATQDDAICAPLPFGQGTEFDGFTKCLAQHRRAFTACLADDAQPTWLRQCDRERPCRSDYLCVRVPNAPPTLGACMPPYFLFQVRVDGHQVGNRS